MRRFVYLTYLKSCLRKDGIFRFLNLIIAFLILKVKPKRIFAKPVLLVIEPTTYCNQKCEMCVRPKIETRIGSMTFDDFKHILNKFEYVTSLALVGLGEPFLNKDILKMIYYAKVIRKIGYIWLSTNGQLLDEFGYDNIMSSHLDEILISMDGATAYTYERIRKGGDFARLLKNIRCLTSYRYKRKRPIVRLVTVVMNDNSFELPEIIKLASSLKADELLIYTVNFDYSDDESLRFRLSSKEVDMLKSLAKTLKLSLRYLRYTGCFEPWLRPYITWDGYVVPCAQRPNAEELNFGNLFQASFEEIWNNKKFQEFRVAPKNARPTVCRQCPRIWK